VLLNVAYRNVGFNVKGERCSGSGRSNVTAKKMDGKVLANTVHLPAHPTSFN